MCLRSFTFSLGVLVFSSLTPSAVPFDVSKEYQNVGSTSFAITTLQGRFFPTKDLSCFSAKNLSDPSCKQHPRVSQALNFFFPRINEFPRFFCGGTREHTHRSRMGRLKKRGTSGVVTQYMTRSHAMKRLQVTLQDFRLVAKTPFSEIIHPFNSDFSSLKTGSFAFSKAFILESQRESSKEKTRHITSRKT